MEIKEEKGLGGECWEKRSWGEGEKERERNFLC